MRFLNAFYYPWVSVFVVAMVMATGGFIWGGITRAAPWHSAPDFFSGGIFGAFAIYYVFGLPVVSGAAVIGAVFGFQRKEPLK